jgi:hypothetical protein
MPSGRHEIRVSWKYKNKTVPDRVFTFDVENPDYGKKIEDPDAAAMRKKFPGATVAVLQQGMPCEALKIKKYQGCRDTHIAGKGNAGGLSHIKIGVHGRKYNGLIHFDLSMLPKGAKVQAAMLKLRSDAGPSKAGITAYRVLCDWNAGTGRLTKTVGGQVLEQTAGGSIKKGECGWEFSKMPEKWGASGCSKPGVDREEKALGTEQKTLDKALPSRASSKKKGKRYKIWYSWDVTSAAQKWTAEPEKNFGVVLDKKSRYFTFHSSEYFDPPMRPKLILVFK